uniref:Uncharacterized protein n=2 Tax=Caenorhabditis japonica TaxID=281687 RepID=A0A8R1ENX5_CAEJA
MNNPPHRKPGPRSKIHSWTRTAVVKPSVTPSRQPQRSSEKQYSSTKVIRSRQSAISPTPPMAAASVTMSTSIGEGDVSIGQQGCSISFSEDQGRSGRKRGRCKRRALSRPDASLLRTLICLSPCVSLRSPPTSTHTHTACRLASPLRSLHSRHVDCRTIVIYSIIVDLRRSANYCISFLRPFSTL